MTPKSLTILNFPVFLLGLTVPKSPEVSTCENSGHFALTKLSDSSPKVKRQIIDAVAACIMADGQVTLEEGELLRAIAAVLACPMPPL